MWSSFKYVKRKQWAARDPKCKKPLNKPVTKIIIHRTNSKECYETDACEYYVKKLQKYHMTKDKRADLKYNFIIARDNRVYEGRGWELQGEHTEGLDDQSIGIAFMSKYSDPSPDKEEMQLLKDLIMEGLRKGYIAKGFKIIPHEELSDDVVCPGLCLLEDIIRFARDLNKSMGAD